MLRPAAEQDIPAIARIFDELIDEEECGNITTGWIRGVYPTVQTAEDGVRSGEMVVAEDDGSVCAAARINKEQVAQYAEIEWKYDAPDDEVMVLHTLVVAPKAQGRGYARQILDHYEQYARENGCTVLRIDTNARNTRARTMYCRRGYREAGIVDCDFNGIPSVQLVGLEKKL